MDDQEYTLPEPVHMSVQEGRDCAQKVLPEGATFNDHYYEALYTFVFPFTDGGPVRRAILVFKPTGEAQVFDMSAGAAD